MHANEPGAVAPTREFTAVWAAYAFHAIGLASLLIWPAIAGLLINYARRGQTGSLLDSHHRWLMRTFWFALLWYALAFGVIVASLWPVVAAAIRSAAAPAVLSIGWDALFATIGGAIVGAIGIVAVWVWAVYRLVRGALQLLDAQPVP